MTALYDLAGREPASGRRTVEHYLAAAAPLLELPIDLIVFADPEPAAELTAIRRRAGHAARTRVIELPLEELESYSELGAIEVARSRHPIVNAAPGKDTSLYAVLLWAKFELLGKAIAAADPSPGSHWAWIDVGLAAVAELTPAGLAYRPGCVELLMLRPFEADLLDDPADYYAAIRGHISAGYIPGPTRAWHRLAELFATCSRELLAEGIAATDEQLLAALCLREPELFSFHYGDYSESLANLPRPRGGGENLLMQLRTAREQASWQRAWAIGEPLIEAIGDGSFEAGGAVEAELLDECFTAAYYAGAPDLGPAERVADLYARRVRADPAFRDVFLREEIRMRRNFAFLGEREAALL